jgi:hypothetical protein
VLCRTGDVGSSDSAIKEVEKVSVNLLRRVELAGVPGADERDQLGDRQHVPKGEGSLMGGVLAAGQEVVLRALR